MEENGKKQDNTILSKRQSTSVDRYMCLSEWAQGLLVFSHGKP